MCMCHMYFRSRFGLMKHVVSHVRYGWRASRHTHCTYGVHDVTHRVRHVSHIAQV